MLLKRSMAAVYAPAFSTTTTKGQTFAVQVGNYLSRHRGGVLGQGASVMALALARARESVEPGLHGLEQFRGPLVLGAGPEAGGEHADAKRQQDEIDHDQPSIAASTRSAVLAKDSASATVLASTMSNLAPLRLSSRSRR